MRLERKPIGKFSGEKINRQVPIRNGSLINRDLRQVHAFGDRRLELVVAVEAGIGVARVVVGEKTDLTARHNQSCIRRRECRAPFACVEWCTEDQDT